MRLLRNFDVDVPRFPKTIISLDLDPEDVLALVLLKILRAIADNHDAVVIERPRHHILKLQPSLKLGLIVSLRILLSRCVENIHVGQSESGRRRPRPSILTIDAIHQPVHFDLRELPRGQLLEAAGLLHE